MTDREFVKQHWRESVCLRSLGVTAYSVQLGNPPVWISDYYPIALKAWAEAAAFTRERLEQVRQLRREIEWCMGNLLSAKSWSKYTVIVPPERLGEWAREETTIGRILDRLESELAKLTAGMKPEATA